MLPISCKSMAATGMVVARAAGGKGAVQFVGWVAAGIAIRSFSLNGGVADAELSCRRSFKTATMLWLSLTVKSPGRTTWQDKKCRPSRQSRRAYRERRRPAGSRGLRPQAPPLQSLRRTFHENVGRLAENAPRRVENKPGDQHGHKWVGEGPSRCFDQHAGEHDAKRRQRIASHVDIGRTGVKGVLAFALQKRGDDCVHKDAERGDPDHLYCPGRGVDTEMTSTRRPGCRVR